MSTSSDGASLTTEPARPKAAARRSVPLTIGLGCGGLILLACLFSGAVFVAVMIGMRSNDVYQLALTAAKADPTVVATLGSPIEPGWFTTGQVNVAGASGHANLEIPISGPRGSATVDARADKSAGKWTFSTLNVRIAGRATPLDLLATSATP